VSNKVGTSKKTVSVGVRYGPVFRSLPRDQAAEDGRDVVLKCLVDSNPPASIVWLQEGSDKILSSGEEFRVEVGPRTAGTYRCIAQVQRFPDLQGRVRVLVKGPPLIVSSAVQQGRMGDTVTIDCSTVSIPSPIRITWTYKAREIDLNDPRYEVVEDESEEGLRNILVIHDADAKDFGDYNCSVVNEYGVARKQIRLNKEKTVPVLLLVGGVVALLIVLVIVASLVFCNKRHTSIKGSPVPEKPGAVTVVPGRPIANMYSAPSDNKLDREGLTPTPSMSLGRPFPDLTPTPDETHKTRAASTLNRLSDDSQQTFIPDPDVTGGLGYVPFVDYSGRDYAPVANGRRASLTDPYSTPPLSRNSGTTSDFCTIRRGTRAADLAPLVDPMLRDVRDVLVSPRSPLGQDYTEAPTLRRKDPRNNDMHSQRYTDSPLLHHNDNGILRHDMASMLANEATSVLPSLRANGSAATLARHSASYSRSNSYGSPPPPPYQRGNGRSPKGAATSPTSMAGQTPLILSNLGDPGSPDAQYIFSPEAMMKPGTLV
ncbi:unnamed protein product, partial [Meganyctiphanes norvegica]